MGKKRMAAAGHWSHGFFVIEGGAHSGGLTGGREKVRPKLVTRNASGPLDFNDALGRNRGFLRLEPPRDGRLVDADRLRHGGEAHLPFREFAGEIGGVHAVDSCASLNRSQAPFRRIVLTLSNAGCATHLVMAEIARIHPSKQPRRPHYIPDWAAHFNMSQADLAKELDADKSVVSRWFNGTTPGVDWQVRLAALWQVEREAIFRHPDDDWLSRFFADKTAEERERAKAMLEAAFGKRRA